MHVNATQPVTSTYLKIKITIHMRLPGMIPHHNPKHQKRRCQTNKPPQPPFTLILGRRQQPGHKSYQQRKHHVKRAHNKPFSAHLARPRSKEYCRSGAGVVPHKGNISDDVEHAPRHGEPEDNQGTEGIKNGETHECGVIELVSDEACSGKEGEGEEGEEARAGGGPCGGEVSGGETSAILNKSTNVAGD